MRSNGLYFTADALLSLLLLSALLALPAQQQEADWSQLLALQKENDLLKIWAAEGMPFNEVEIISDAQFVFPGSGMKITLDGKEIPLGAETGSAIASEIIFFDSGMQKHTIQLAVYR
ncbi:MAG: hypothetical protein NTW59_01055 [Candidatus Diapherotrites archaeon]|nr:hypothetical protein [Candidatus Diapherotrites archaeon]